MSPLELSRTKPMDLCSLLKSRCFSRTRQRFSNRRSIRRSCGCCAKLVLATVALSCIGCCGYARLPAPQQRRVVAPMFDVVAGRVVSSDGEYRVSVRVEHVYVGSPSLQGTVFEEGRIRNRWT